MFIPKALKKLTLLWRKISLKNDKEFRVRYQLKLKHFALKSKYNSKFLKFH